MTDTEETMVGPSMVRASGLRVAVGSGVGPVLLAGLHMYNRSIRDKRPERVVETEWPRLFSQNPFGPGLYVAAWARQRLVGFVSLIPTEMRLGGATVIGAKSEFLVVEREFRKEHDPESGLRLPVAIKRASFEGAASAGIHIVFSRGTEAASAINRELRGWPLDVNGSQWVTLFRRSTSTARPSDARNRIREAGALTLSIGGRTLGRIHASPTVAVDMFDDFSVVPFEATTSNMLVNDSPTELGFRFGGDRHWRYLVHEVGRPPAAFVFSQFLDDAHLMWWSTTEVSRAGFQSVVSHAARRAREQQLASLFVSLPETAPTSEWSLGKWGYLRRPYRYTVFVECADPSLRAMVESRAWRVSNSHLGYY